MGINSFSDLFAEGLNIYSAFSKSKQLRNERRAKKSATVERDSAIALYAPWLEPMLRYYFKEDGSLAKSVKWYRSQISSSNTPKISEDEVLLFDVIRMIRAVALPKDEIRMTDATILSILSLQMLQAESLTIQEFYEVIEIFREEEEGNVKWTLPNLLMSREDPDLPKVIEIYLDLSEKIAGYPEMASEARHVGLSQLRVQLRAFSEPNEELEDMRYILLKISPGCSLEALKAAYHHEAFLWHPDKLAHLAPELQEQAERKMSKLNEAYESLCAEMKV